MRKNSLLSTKLSQEGGWKGLYVLPKLLGQTDWFGNEHVDTFLYHVQVKVTIGLVHYHQSIVQGPYHRPIESRAKSLSLVAHGNVPLSIRPAYSMRKNSLLSTKLSQEGGWKGLYVLPKLLGQTDWFGNEHVDTFLYHVQVKVTIGLVHYHQSIVQGPYHRPIESRAKSLSLVAHGNVPLSIRPAYSMRKNSLLSTKLSQEGGWKGLYVLPKLLGQTDWFGNEHVDTFLYHVQVKVPIGLVHLWTCWTTFWVLFWVPFGWGSALAWPKLSHNLLRQCKLHRQ